MPLTDEQIKALLADWEGLSQQYPNLAEKQDGTIAELCTLALRGLELDELLKTRTLGVVSINLLAENERLSERVKVLEEALLTLAKEYSSGAMFNFLGDPEAHPSIRRARKALEGK